MKKMMFILCAVLTLLGTNASSKTLVVYYSYTGNCHEIVTTLTSQIQADVLEIQPADKGLKYEANGYALGTQLLNAIKAAPNNAGSYPAIDANVNVNVSANDNDNAVGSTYDLSGKLVGEASKGIYIKNGKKVVK